MAQNLESKVKSIFCVENYVMLNIRTSAIKSTF